MLSLRKLILLFLIACLPLQGLAAGVKALAHPEQQQSSHHAMAMTMDDDMAEHGCCPHDDTTPAQPMNSCDDGHHCPLCHVSVTPTVILQLLANADLTLHPAPALSISRFYPEQPQRPPLSHNS
jgi:hypothetical protein